MPPKRHVFGAMFDVRPMDASGRVVVEKLQNVEPEVNLRPQAAKAMGRAAAIQSHAEEEVLLAVSTTSKSTSEPSVAEVPAAQTVQPKEEVLKEFEQALAEEADLQTILASAGASLEASTHQTAPRYFPPASYSRAVASSSPARPQPPLPQIYFASHSPVSRELEHLLQSQQIVPAASIVQISGSLASLDQVYTLPQEALHARQRIDLTALSPDLWHSAPESSVAQTPKIMPKKRPHLFWRHWGLSIFFFACVVAFVSWLTYSRGVYVRNNILQNGSNAVANLEKAKLDLKEYHFSKAADSFALAYDDLNRASGTLSKMGASFLSLFGSLPGLNKVAAANNLVEAGQSLSKSGENLSLAFDKLASIDVGSFFDYEHPEKQKSLGHLLKEFRGVIKFADTHINRANSLLASIDPHAIPEDKRSVFQDFTAKVPEFKDYIGSALAYSDFLVNLVGEKGERRYLLLFQNNTELRPTGGFPGSYALITFKDGKLKNVVMDDIYNIDGQIKEKIIPPVPMQHITPNWGMRDANWFADFPTSARKIQEMYKKDGGGPVDGVLSMTPDVILDILKHVGPIEMPEYNLTLTHENFLAEIQEEIEYGANRTQPKTVLKELQPKLFAKLREQGKDVWYKIATDILARTQQKHMLAYFNDKDLQAIAQEHGISGHIKQDRGDYLQVTYSNVKGSKTDAVTDNRLDLKSRLVPEAIEHTLAISRTHQGGDHDLGFYNRHNSAYIRVYVPKSAQLEAIAGHTITSYKPLLNYAKEPTFKKDPDLAELEGSISNPYPGVDIYEESDRKVIGFWMVVKPKEATTVTVRYQVPQKTVIQEGSYRLLWQKQSGNNKDTLHYQFAIPDSKSLISASSDLKKLGNALVWDTDLLIDKEIAISFK